MCERCVGAHTFIQLSSADIKARHFSYLGSTARERNR